MTHFESSDINVKDISFINNIKSMAVIGTSKKRNFFFLKNHQENFKGKLYAVNPTVKEISGFDRNYIYASLKDIPGDVDFVFIAVPPSLILEVIDECVEKGVKLATIFTAEFSDSGTKEGVKLEKELLRRAKNKIRLLGPNGLGLYYPKLGIAWRPKFSAESGNISFLAQSGGLCNLMIYAANQLGMYFSKVFSFGNGADLDFVDLLYFLCNDPETKIILCYIEGIKKERGYELKKLLKQNKKPIAIVRGGKTETGSIAAKTHTATISGENQIWRANFKQNNIIEMDSIEQLISLAYLIKSYNLFELNNIALLSSSGGYGVILADLIEKEGINIPQFSPDIQNQITSQFYTLGTSSRNPLDVSAQVFNSEVIYNIIELVLNDKKIDGLIVDLPSYYFNSNYSFRIRLDQNYEDKIVDALTLGIKYKKPLIPIIKRINCPKDWNRLFKKLSERNVPIFDDPLEFIPLLPKISEFTRKRNK